MHTKDFTSPEVPAEFLRIGAEDMRLIKRNLDASAVVVAYLAPPPYAILKQILSNHTESVERILFPANSRDLTLYAMTQASTVDTNFFSSDFNHACPIMKAERMSTALCQRFKMTEQTYGCLQVIQSESRLWSEDDKHKLRSYAIGLGRNLQRAPFHIKKLENT